jgi:glycosyltransferase, family 2
MERNKKICTVLIISYNHAKYISKAIDSVIFQKTKYNFVIKIFDDASKDATGEIIEKYEKKYPDKIQCFISEKNLGAQENIWRAFTSVDTKYFITLEADDYWCNENKLEYQIDAMEKHPECSFCGHNTYLYALDNGSREYAEGTVCCTQKFLKAKRIFTYRDFKNVHDGGYIPYVSARLIRTEVIQFDKIKYKESVLFDFAQFYYLLLKGRYYYIDIPMSVYQRTGSGVCSGVTPVEFLNTFIQNSIDFNKETNNIIADKIYADCMLQIDFRLGLYKDRFIKKIFPFEPDAKENKGIIDMFHDESIVFKESYFDKEKYYFVCNGGIGHTLIMSAIKKELETKYGAEICFIIAKGQEFIPRLYNINNFIVADISESNMEDISDNAPYPEKGKLYIAHPFAHREARMYYEAVYNMYSTERYVPWLLKFLDLPKETKINYPDQAPVLNKKSMKIVEKLGDLNRLIIFLPEANTLSNISETIWEKKVKELKNHNYEVISCPYNKEYTIKGTRYVDLTSEEIMYVGMKCHSVYTIRNGFCELLFKRGQNLNIFFPSHSSHYIYSMNIPGATENVKEEIVLLPSHLHLNKEITNISHIPLLFGIIRIPDSIYRFYDRHRHRFKNKKLIKFFVKWR